MKVSVPKDFGNTSKKPVLPLVPEPIKSVKKEDLTTVNLHSDPADHDSTQVKFSFKGLDGDHETPREILEWRRNVERALTGLDLNANGLSSYNMCKQFMRGSALSSFIAKAGTILADKKAKAIVAAELARDNYPAATDAGLIIADFNALHTAVVTASTRNPLDHLNEAHGPEAACMYVNCPPVSNYGTSNQCSGFTERPSSNGDIPTMVRMQDLAACPSGKLGSTSSPAAPRVPPGFVPK